MRFRNLTLIDTFDNFLEFPLRLYRSKVDGEMVRFHFGFPKSVVEPLQFILESSIGWREHWTESSGYWIYYLDVIGKVDPLPRGQLAAALRDMAAKYKRTVKAVQSFGSRKET